MARWLEPSADVVEAILGQAPVPCPECGAEVLVPRADRLAKDTAMDVFKMQGLGPINRSREEEALPEAGRVMWDAE